MIADHTAPWCVLSLALALSVGGLLHVMQENDSLRHGLLSSLSTKLELRMGNRSGMHLHVVFYRLLYEASS